MKNQGMGDAENVEARLEVASDLESRERAVQACHGNVQRRIRVNLDSLKTKLRADLSEIFGLDPRELIRAIGRPLCPRCRQFLHYRSISEVIPETEGVLLVVVPWSVFHRTLSITAAAEIYGATRVVLEQRLHLVEQIAPEVLLPSMAADRYGGVVAKSLSRTMERSQLNEEVRRIAESIGFPLSLVSVNNRIIVQSILIAGEWWCSSCETGCSIDGHSFEFGLMVNRERHPFMTTHQVLSEPIGDLCTVLRTQGVANDTALFAQFNLFFNLITGTDLTRHTWCTGWEDLSYADRYIARLIPMALSHLSGVCAVLEDLSLLDGTEREVIRQIILNLGPKCSVIWCEDSEVETDLRSEVDIYLADEGGSSVMGAVNPAAVLECDSLPPPQGDLLLDVLEIRHSLIEVFSTLPESRRRGLHDTDFMKSDGTLGRGSLEIEKQAYSLKRIIETPIEEVIAKVGLPYQMWNCLSILSEMGYGGLYLAQPLAPSHRKIFRLIPWLCAQSDYPVQISNPLTGCTPDEVAPFTSLVRVMHQHDKEIFLKTRQRWVRQYFGVNK